MLSDVLVKHLLIELLNILALGQLIVNSSTVGLDNVGFLMTKVRQSVVISSVNFALHLFFMVLAIVLLFDQTPCRSLVLIHISIVKLGVSLIKVGVVSTSFPVVLKLSKHLVKFGCQGISFLGCLTFSNVSHEATVRPRLRENFIDGLFRLDLDLR